MTNEEFDLIKKAYINALSDVKCALYNNTIKIKLGNGASIKAPIPEQFILKILWYAIGSFNYGSKDLIDEEEYLSDKDYKIHLEDIE